jgi:xanthine dehydrogenase YagR molybdenum-binding subunit
MASRGSGFSRRGFLKGAVVGAALPVEALAAGGPRRLGPGPAPLELTVNGARHALQVEPRATLAQVLRDQLGLTGTKVSCDRGACSACTVHVDGQPLNACTVLAHECAGRAVVTIEGLARGEALHPVQQAFLEHDALQCGFCTPGMVMSTAGLLAAKRAPTLDDVKGAVSGNLCRCGTYPKVFAAALAAAGQGAAPGSLELIAAGDGAPPPAGTVPVGLGGGRVAFEPRELPPGEPAAWPTNVGLKVVGKPTPRLDGRAKVTGAARYTFDVKLPGMLHGRRVVSPHPHARVTAVDTSAAEKLPGVKAVHVVEHGLEGARLRDPALEPPARYPTVRYVGQVVAAVAATTPELAEAAARAVRVTYEPLPFAADLDDARRPDAPRVYPGPVDMGGTGGGGGAARGLPMEGNVRGPALTERGDVDKALAQAAVKVGGRFRTQVQTHSAMEPHGVVADFRPDGLSVFISTQGVSSVRDELATVFGLPAAQVRVRSEYMGGGFGAKFGAGHYGVIAAHLSKKAGAPVRLMLDRREEHLAGGNRPSSDQTLTLGASQDGALTAVKLESYGTGGIATGAGVGWAADRLYPAPSFRGAQYDVFTNASPATAFRAPGMPQAMFALEQLVDELAERLGKDPLVLRDLIDADAEGSIEREARRAERALGAARVDWARRHRPGAEAGPVKRGLGMAQVLWGRFVDPNSSAEVRIHKDGSVELRTGVADLGTGSRTALAMLVAEELGLGPSQVTVRLADTDLPYAPGSGGSKTEVSLSPAVRTAAALARRKLFEAVAPRLKAQPDELACAGGRVFARGREAQGLPLAKACASLPGDFVSQLSVRAADYGGPPKGGYGGVQFAAVSVDTQTGIVQVERVVAVHDCGRPLNPLAIQSQINGGVLHGLSWALYEDRVLDPRNGQTLNPTLDSYQLAGARETPRIDVVLLEQYVGRSSTDAHGIGEPANIATAAAIANAFYNATGKRIRRLPMKPPTVLAALAGKEV